MTVSNTTTVQTYNGNGVTQNFSIPFAYIETAAIKVYLVDADDVETLQTLGVDYTLTTTLVQMTSAPSSVQRLRIRRESTFNQPTNLAAGSPYDPEMIEEQFDRIVLQTQELETRMDALEAANDTEVTTFLLVPDWASSEEYVENQVVYRSQNLYRATEDHTSGDFNNDYTNGKWEKLQSQGIQGPQGDKGAKGDTGATGATGPAGADGNIARVNGKQKIRNNQSSALAIDASGGEAGQGYAMSQDASSGTSAKFYFEIYRKDDAETRFSTGVLVAHYIESVWYVQREVTTNILGEGDGVDFSVGQVGDVLTVEYTSDNMTGGNYSDDSYIRFYLIEMPSNF